MNHFSDYFPGAILVGVAATAVMDLIAIFRQRVFRTPSADYGLVGRWIAHMTRGRFVHDSIGRAPSIPGERWIGWFFHYIVGIVFAAILLVLAGTEWMAHPTAGPALAVGIGSVLAPFLLMQPGMGAGLAACRTPDPPAARMRSLITHAIFGLGLYAGGWLAYAVRYF